MEKVHNKYADAYYTLFTSLYIFFFYHLSVPVTGDSGDVYNPQETIFLYCGASGNFSSVDGPRNWTGDIKSKYFPSNQSQNSESKSISAQKQPDDIPDKHPYIWARFSHSQFTYTFNLSPGQKFIRLYFYATSYPNLDMSKAFFSVKAGSFTLLRNFSTQLTAEYSADDTILKEYCINVEENQSLNITFSPTQDYNDSYAFINGIEIVSMPLDFYYTTATGEMEFPFVGQKLGAQYSFSHSIALENLYRVNVGGRDIPTGDDTGMYRTWSPDDAYLMDARPSAVPVNFSEPPKFDYIKNYSAPIEVYQIARTMGQNATVNENYRLTWQFSVDSGFTYLVRLHFCEFQGEITVTGNRVFQIYIADRLAEPRADVIGWSGGNGVPIYKDFVVMMGSTANQKKQNLSIALHPAPELMTSYSDAILNGVEIFKVDNSRSLAGPNPDVSTTAIGPTSQPTKPSNNNRKIIIPVVVGVASSLVVVCVVFLFVWRRRNNKVKEYS